MFRVSTGYRLDLHVCEEDTAKCCCSSFNGGHGLRIRLRTYAIGFRARVYQHQGGAAK